jgi:hypothetical protein
MRDTLHGWSPDSVRRLMDYVGQAGGEQASRGAAEQGRGGETAKGQNGEWASRGIGEESRTAE